MSFQLKMVKVDLEEQVWFASLQLVTEVYIFHNNHPEGELKNQEFGNEIK